jgi:hypothetical protein
MGQLLIGDLLHPLNCGSTPIQGTDARRGDAEGYRSPDAG